MSRARGEAMLGSMMTYYRAWENRRFVRRLLREKQPELAAALVSVATRTLIAERYWRLHTQPPQSRGARGDGGRR